MNTEENSQKLWEIFARLSGVLPLLSFRKLKLLYAPSCNFSNYKATSFASTCKQHYHFPDVFLCHWKIYPIKNTCDTDNLFCAACVKQ